jgi:hypothetical protein
VLSVREARETLLLRKQMAYIFERQIADAPTSLGGFRAFEASVVVTKTIKA